MTKEREEALLKLNAEVKALLETVKEIDLPFELLKRIREAANDVLEGEEMAKVVDALLLYAYEAGMQMLKDKKSEEEINWFTDHMEHRASLMFHCVSSMLYLNSSLKKAETEKEED